MYELLKGTIIAGKQLSRTLWFPTLNCSVWDGAQNLGAGTYRVNIHIDGRTYRGIGPRFADRQLFEVHLLDIRENFSTNDLIILPLQKIRDNKSFASLDELKRQIQKDLQRAQTHPQKVITFGTFDHFHPGHEYYLTHAKWYGDYLITIVARDDTVNKIKWHLPDENEQQRFLALIDLDYIDLVELGDENDHYACLLTHMPEVICLWYDQNSFASWLRNRCDTHWLSSTHLCRLPSFSPDKRKSSLFRK